MPPASEPKLALAQDRLSLPIAPGRLRFVLAADGATPHLVGFAAAA